MTVMEKRQASKSAALSRGRSRRSLLGFYSCTHRSRAVLCRLLALHVRSTRIASVHNMARSRRRTGRTQKTPDTTGATDDDSQLQAMLDGDENGEQTQDDKCPACKDGEPDEAQVGADKEQWVRCDACKTWFHWRCAGEGDLDAVDKWCVSLSCVCSTVYEECWC